MEKKYYIQIYRHTLPTAEDSEWVELESLEIHPDIVQQLVEWGIVEIRGSHVHFRQAVRLQKLMRLRRKLGVNLPGAAIIVDLLERIETLQDEIDRLKTLDVPRRYASALFDAKVRRRRLKPLRRTGFFICFLQEAF